jgi:hypothetical protein
MEFNTIVLQYSTQILFAKENSKKKKKLIYSILCLQKVMNDIT